MTKIVRDEFENDPLLSDINRICAKPKRKSGEKTVGKKPFGE